jgi:phage tail sheath gpL-like
MISQSGSIEKKAGIIVAATNGQCNMYNTVGEAMVMGPNLSTAATNGSTLSSGTNDQLKRILYAFYPHCPAADFEIAAVLAAAFASHTNPNHHFDSEILLNIPAPFDLNNWMLFTEMQTLLVNGVTPIEVLTGGVSAINRAVLCNTENADVFDICNCTTLDFLRDWVLKLRHDRYPQVNMDDDTLEALTSDVVGLLYNGQNDYDPKLFDQVDRYKDAVIITRDAAGRANLAVPVAVVPGLHVLAFQLQLIPLE